MKAPRVQVSLSPEAFRAVQAVAKASRGSMSSVIGEIVEESAPVLLRLSEVIRQVVQSKEDQRAELLAILERESTVVRGHAKAAYRSIAALSKAAESSRASTGGRPRSGRPPDRVKLIRRSRSPV